MYTNHAYSIISAFTMTDAKYAEKMIMMRSLHGGTLYDGKWKASDPEWTDELASQVPLGIDPRTSESSGIFVAPLSVFSSIGGRSCLDRMYYAHDRDDEGYVSTWHDHILEDLSGKQQNDYNYYSFTPPKSSGGDLYFTVESYPFFSHPMVDI
jgi:hypothetical protein